MIAFAIVASFAVGAVFGGIQASAFWRRECEAMQLRHARELEAAERAYLRYAPVADFEIPELVPHA